MLVISSSDLINEFTLYAEKCTNEKDTLFVQRSNGNNLVVMSLEQYNEMQKKLFMAQQEQEQQDK